MNPVVELRNSLEELVSESRALRVDIGSFERSRRRGALINAVFSALAVCAMVLIGTIAYQNNELSATIKSCTTPGQPCYMEQRRSTNSSVNQLVRSSIYAAQCQRSTKTDQELEDCVETKIKNAVAGTTP